MPSLLIDALIEQGARELTVVNNNAAMAIPAWPHCSRPGGYARSSARFRARPIRRCSTRFTRRRDRTRTGAAGQPGRAHPRGRRRDRRFFSPTAYGTQLAEGKETRLINGRQYVFELPIQADFALIKAERATAGVTGVPQGGRATSADHGDGGQVHRGPGRQHCRAGRT